MTSRYLLICTVAVLVSLGSPLTVQAQPDQKSRLETREANNLDQLLELVEQRRLHWSQENERREARFRQNRNRQQQILRETRQEQKKEEETSDRLETRYEENEIRINDLTGQLSKRLGSLRELFGVLQQVAGDTRSVFESSIVSAQYPNREKWLNEFAKKMGTSTQLATIEEIERLWFELQREMTESGKVVRFSGEVKEVTGETRVTDVIRVGAFNLVADGEYLNYSDTGSIVSLPRQPSSRYVTTVESLTAAEGDSDNVLPFGFDPTRGSLLSLLIQSKTLQERIEDGGGVGYLIISLGIIGILLALFQLVYISIINLRVKKQQEIPHEPEDTNPLGRILLKARESRGVDVETLELKMSEAILGETPRLNRFLALIQVIYAVSPLLGLLGTVIGMILTFQAITLFGTGDPQTMAGGISTALMTTVLGLCVAIPTVLLHSIVSSRSKAVIHILEEQSAGIIASQSELAGQASRQSTL